MTKGESEKEIAYVCQKNDGYGMIIETHSDDLGVLGEEASPACAHLKNVAGEYLGKFAVTRQSPQSIEHVIDVDKSNPIPLKYKERIVEWASKRSMRFDEEDGTVTNWGVLKATCRAFRVEKKCNGDCNHGG